MTPGRQNLLSHGPFKQAFAIGREFTERTNVTRSHLRIAIELLALARRESGQLNFTGTDYAVANLGGTFWFGAGPQLLIVHGWNVDMNINAVEQRTRHLRHVSLNNQGRAMALAGSIVKVSARTRIHPTRHQ